MLKTLIAKKLGMTQIFDEQGQHVPVTVLQVGPCVVTQVKTAETDRVAAVQIGFGERKRKNTTKPMAGHFDKVGVAPRQFLRDVAPDGDEMPEPGAEFNASEFEGVTHVNVTGTSKGKGYAGVMKKYGFAGSPASHGGRFGRRGGSIGTSATPSKVQKGRKMSGQMGNKQVTVRNLQVVRVDTERNVLLVKGAVVGANGGIVLVSKTGAVQ
jgi:large subunit ribosomal protein L3